MKRIALLFATLFILVIGISCASAASLNSHSPADKVGSGDVVDHAPARLSKYDEKRLFLTKYEDEKKLALTKYNDEKKLALTKYNDEKRLYQSSSSSVSPLGVPVLGGGLGGGGNQHFY